MSISRDGWAAFPFGDMAGYEPDRGMSLRDWFAGKALTGLCASAMYAEMPPARLAELAYDQADCMLIRRSRVASSDAKSED